MDVAPHAGAWIEMATLVTLPTPFRVAPHAGAWIEIAIEARVISWLAGRSPRGSVD